MGDSKLTARPKRAERKARPVGKVGARPPLKTLSFKEMDPVHLKSCLGAYTGQFRRARMYEFLKWSQKLPAMHPDYVSEFVRNYDSATRRSRVRDRNVVIDEGVLHQALVLPITGADVVDCDVRADFSAASYFKSAEESFVESQGWKTGDAITPQLKEWMRFAQKRLVLARHATYVAKRSLFAIVETMNGGVFNWASFVARKINVEIEHKRKSGEIHSLTCSEYISEAVRYQLQCPASDEETEQTAESHAEPENVQGFRVDTRFREPVEEPAQTSTCTGARSTALPPGGAKKKGCKRKFTARAGSGIAAAPRIRRATLKETVIFRLELLMESVESDVDTEEEERMKEIEEANKQVMSMRKECRALAEALNAVRRELGKVRAEKNEAMSRLEEEVAASILATGARNHDLRRLEGLGRETREANNDVFTSLRKHVGDARQEKQRMLDAVNSLAEKNRMLREQLSAWKSESDTGVGSFDIWGEMEKAEERLGELEDHVRELRALNKDLRDELYPNSPGDEDGDEEHSEDTTIGTRAHIPMQVAEISRAVATEEHSDR